MSSSAAFFEKSTVLESAVLDVAAVDIDSMWPAATSAPSGTGVGIAEVESASAPVEGLRAESCRASLKAFSIRSLMWLLWKLVQMSLKALSFSLTLSLCV